MNIFDIRVVHHVMFVDLFTQQHAVADAMDDLFGLLLFRDVARSVWLALLHCLTKVDVDL
jgi:hypothetical protein